MLPHLLLGKIIFELSLLGTVDEHGALINDSIGKQLFTQYGIKSYSNRYSRGLISASTNQALALEIVNRAIAKPLDQISAKISLELVRSTKTSKQKETNYYRAIASHQLADDYLKLIHCYRDKKTIVVDVLPLLGRYIYINNLEQLCYHKK